MLVHEFQSVLANSLLLTEWRSSTSHPAHEAEVDDSATICDILDACNVLGSYTFVGPNLFRMPKYGSEEINAAAFMDRQIRTETMINSLSSALSQAVVEMEQRLTTLSSAINTQTDKLLQLSEQLNATASLVKELKQSRNHDSGDKDRLMNVIIFRIAENQHLSSEKPRRN